MARIESRSAQENAVSSLRASADRSARSVGCALVEWDRDTDARAPCEIAQRSGVPAKSRSDPGFLRNRAAIRGSCEIAQRSGVPAKSRSDFVGWFCGVVLWGGFMEWRCRRSLVINFQFVCRNS
jgi:hypothetical protein